jgi:hypothetical protein
MYDSVMPMHEGRMLPSFSLREIDLPEIRYWEVNDEHYLILKVKMVGKRDQRVSGAPEDAEKLEGDFEVHSIKSLGDKPVDAKSLAQKDWERTVAKAKSGKF